MPAKPHVSTASRYEPEVRCKSITLHVAKPLIRARGGQTRLLKEKMARCPRFFELLCPTLSEAHCSQSRSHEHFLLQTDVCACLGGLRGKVGRTLLKIRTTLRDAVIRFACSASLGNEYRTCDLTGGRTKHLADTWRPGVLLG